MLPPCSHLALKRGVYYFRRKLPKPHSGEIALSLRTNNFREAQHLATLASSAFHLFFRSPPPMSEVAAILRAHLAQALETDRQQHLSTPHGRPVYTTPCPDDHESSVDRDMDVVGDLLSDAREALATRDTRRVANLVVEYEKQHALPKHSLTELALGLLKVNVQVLEAAERRLVSGAAVDILLDEQSLPTNETAASARRAGTPLMSTVVADYVGLMTGTEWTGQTKGHNSMTYRMFIACVGDFPIGAYDRTHTSAFRDMLRKLPAMYGKARRWHGMTPAEAVEAAGLDASIQRLSSKTIKRYFSALGGLFKHARERGLYAGENPAYGFRLVSKRKANAGRQMWSGDKLKELFTSPLFAGCKSARRRHVPGSEIIKDEKYWLPILALYHGNRLEEFAQLQRSDVRRAGDIWFLDINDDGQKQLKNKQSHRKVPLHPELQRLGFLKYVEATTADRADALLFPKLKPGGADMKYGHAFTKWWSRYRQAIGLYEQGLDYHSFRHGVTTKLTEAGVTPPIIDQLTGHAGTGISQTVYTKELSLPVLYEAICKVRWPEVSL